MRTFPYFSYSYNHEKININNDNEKRLLLNFLNALNNFTFQFLLILLKFKNKRNKFLETMVQPLILLLNYISNNNLPKILNKKNKE